MTRDCIKTTVVMECIHTNCPPEVVNEVSNEIWPDAELGNDTAYYNWEDERDAERYPITAAYLRSRGITNCSIHYWW